MTPAGGTAEKVVLVRNPWGTTTYSAEWNKDDAKWTQALRDSTKAAFGVDPVVDWDNGFFFAPISKWINNACFMDYSVAFDRASEGYKDTRYDAEKVDEQSHNYSFTVPAKSGDLYITVESYPVNSVPPTCTTGTYTYTQNGTQQTGNSTKPQLYFALYNSNDMNNAIDYKYYFE